MIPNDFINKLLADMVKSMQGDVEGIGNLSELMRDRNTSVFTRSWSAKIIRLPDGRVVIERFDGVPMVPELEGTMQPLVDVFEEKDEYIIVAEVPGVDEDNLVTKLREEKTKKVLIISSKDEKRKYYREIDLPLKVANGFTREYRNGVLEIHFKIPEEK